MARSAITQEERDFVETWENIATYQNVIIRLDHRGEEKHEVITGRRVFMITTEERVITQDKVVDSKNDPFKNGSFRPISTPEDVSIETNPNALSDEEIFDIFASSDLAWEEWMKVIDSPATLNRMIDLADDAPGVTVKRLRDVQMRLRAVKPQTRLTSNDETLQKFLDREIQGGDQPAPRERRGTGGRSAAYRDN